MRAKMCGARRKRGRKEEWGVLGEECVCASAASDSLSVNHSRKGSFKKMNRVVEKYIKKHKRAFFFLLPKDGVDSPHTDWARNLKSTSPKDRGRC